MSNLTFGPPVVLDGAIPEAPLHSLLKTPGVLVDEPTDRWVNGAQIYGYPVDEPLSWDPCSSGTLRTKSEGGDNPVPSFGSIVVYLPITCSAMSIGDPEEFRGRAELALDAVESFAIEREISQGLTLPTNPYFSDAAVTLLAAGAAVTPAVGLSYLEDAIGATGRQGLLHVTPAVGSQWFSGSIGDPTQEGLYTALGTPVSVGGGYSGARPSGGAAAAAGQAWAFATGPVRVRHAEVNVLEIDEVLDRSINDVTFRAERYVLAEWDTALQAAVLIDWTP